MKTLIDTFRDFVEKEQLFTKEDKLLLACSGGLDSTVLAHVLHAEGYDFAIAHMNFQLRGEASDGDAAFVEELARTLDAKFYCKAVDVKGEAKPGESTQMTARWLRYAWFREVVEANGFSSVLVAHHLDDNLETLLINLIRGTGLNGLSGMQPRFGYVLRPLLNVASSTIRAFANEHQIAWREDASNASDDYLRNRIRHHLSPILTEQFNLSPKTISMTMENLRGAHSIYWRHLSEENERRKTQTGEMIYFDRTGTQDWGWSEQRAFLFSSIAVYGFTTDQINQIVRMADNSFLDASVYRIYISKDQWIIGPIPAETPLPPLVINELPATFPLGETILYLSMVRRSDNLDSHLFLAPPTFPLHLRPRQKGDRFQPLGMGGKTKKVKDYMIDEKIPVWIRDQIYLLTNDQDEIMAIPGYCISENFKVLPEHQEVLRISWT